MGGASWFWWRQLLDATWHSTDSECQVAQYWQRVSSGTVLTASIKWHSTYSECQVAQYWQRVSSGTILTASVKWHSIDECQVAQYWQRVSNGTVLTASIKWHSTYSECQVAQYWRVSSGTVITASVKWHSTYSECKVAQYWQRLSSPIPVPVSVSLLPPHEMLCRSTAVSTTTDSHCWLHTTSTKRSILCQRSATDWHSPHSNQLFLQFLRQCNWSTHFCSESAANSNQLQVLHHVALTTAADGCLSFPPTKYVNVANGATCLFSFLLATETVSCERRGIYLPLNTVRYWIKYFIQYGTSFNTARHSIQCATAIFLST